MSMTVKTNGLRPTHRNMWLLLHEGVLKPLELQLFNFYVDQMDFDKSHQGIGTFTVDFPTIAGLFGYSTIPPCNTVRKLHNKLVKLGFIYPSKTKNVFAVHNPYRYIASTLKWQGKASETVSAEKNRPLSEFIDKIASNVQLIENNVQQVEQNVQQNEKNKAVLLKDLPLRSLGSSKVNNLNSNIHLDVVASPTESEVWRKEPYDLDYFDCLLTPDDAKWCQEHISSEGVTTL